MRTLLGHLTHHISSKRPQELWMVMSEVRLRRLEELLPRVPCELRPALAVGDPAVLFVDRGHVLVRDGG